MMISTTLAALSADGVLPGMSGSTPGRSHPASNDAPATPAADIFRNSLRVNVRLSLSSCVPLAQTIIGQVQREALSYPKSLRANHPAERCDSGQARVQSVHDCLSLRAAALRGRGVRTPLGSDAGR